VSRVGPQAADDVVAESFVAAFQARGRFDHASGTDALPWLLGVATNVLARHRAAERRWVAQCAAEFLEHEVPRSFEDDVDDRTDAALAKHSLARAMRRLPSREREPLLLHVFGELSYEDIASTLGVPAGTVASRINRGRARLSAWMEKSR
jgi:RNA polymerase sigma-70 factor (ECF subfamily)